MLAIGFLSGTRIRTVEEALRQAGSDRVIRHPGIFCLWGVNPERAFDPALKSRACAVEGSNTGRSLTFKYHLTKL